MEEQDIEHALDRFQEEIDASLIRKKIVLDTSNSTAESTMTEFVESYMPLMSEKDRTRLLTFRALMTT